MGFTVFRTPPRALLGRAAQLKPNRRQVAHPARRRFACASKLLFNMWGPSSCSVSLCGLSAWLGSIQSAAFIKTDQFRFCPWRFLPRSPLRRRCCLCHLPRPVRLTRSSHSQSMPPSWHRRTRARSMPTYPTCCATGNQPELSVCSSVARPVRFYKAGERHLRSNLWEIENSSWRTNQTTRKK